MPPPFPLSLILIQSTLHWKRARARLPQILPLWFDIMAVPHSSSRRITQQHRLCCQVDLFNLIWTLRMICADTQCGVPFWYVSQFCILCGHFSASHSNGLPARLHCCGFCHLQIHSSTDYRLNEKHLHRDWVTQVVPYAPAIDLEHWLLLSQIIRYVTMTVLWQMKWNVPSGNLSFIPDDRVLRK